MQADLLVEEQTILAGVQALEICPSRDLNGVTTDVDDAAVGRMLENHTNADRNTDDNKEHGE
jgi:hypothetical protein